jgi:hypothetical protein
MHNIDFKLQKKIREKYTNNFPEYTDKYWIIHSDSKQTPIKINKISTESNFNENKYFILVFYFFIQKTTTIYSFRTLSDYRVIVRDFVIFLNKYHKEVISFNMVDYKILLSYSNYLQNKKNNDKKYNMIISLLKKIGELDNKLVNQNVIDFKIPKVKFQNNTTKRIYYSDDEFNFVVKTSIYFINEYLSKNKNITDNMFVQFSYWLIACCTGFNKTGLNSLTTSSFEEIETNKYLIVAEKNRGASGFQHVTLTLNDNNNLIIKVFEKLKELNNKNQDQLSEEEKYSLFPLFNKNFKNNNNESFKYFSYNGNINFILDGAESRKIINNQKFGKFATFSTLKIRRNWSTKVFDITNSIKIASNLLNHKNVSTTVKHYLGSNISLEIQKKFNLFQELLFCYSKNKNFESWTEFQEIFNLKEKNNEIIVKEISEGIYDTISGKCIKNDNNICRSYLQCFKCENYSIIGDKDLWKVLSLKELLKEKENSKFFIDNYLPIINSIEDIIENFDQDIIVKVKNNFHKFGLHPFFKNKTIFDKIIEDFERILINE